MKIKLNAPGQINGRNFTGAIESRLLVKDRLRTEVTLEGTEFSLSSVMGSIKLEKALDGQKNGSEIEVEIPDEAECDIDEIREALEATFSNQN